MKKYLVLLYDYEQEEGNNPHENEWFINEHQLKSMLESELYNIAYQHNEMWVLDSADLDFTITINKTPKKSKISYNETIR